MGSRPELALSSAIELKGRDSGGSENPTDSTQSAQNTTWHQARSQDIPALCWIGPRKEATLEMGGALALGWEGGWGKWEGGHPGQEELTGATA